MTYHEWRFAFALLNSDAKRLRKYICKLSKLYDKRKEKAFNKLLPKVQFHSMYVKELFRQLDNNSYWHRDNLNMEVWAKYKEEMAMFLNCLDAIIPARR